MLSGADTGFHVRGRGRGITFVGNYYSAGLDEPREFVNREGREAVGEFGGMHPVTMF